MARDNCFFQIQYEVSRGISCQLNATKLNVNERCDAGDSKY